MVHHIFHIIQSEHLEYMTGAGSGWGSLIGDLTLSACQKLITSIDHSKIRKFEKKLSS